LNHNPSEELSWIEELSSTVIQPMFELMPLPLFEIVVRRTITPAVAVLEPVPTRIPERWFCVNVESSTVTLVPEAVTFKAP
jgi:hypothetical protein